eukprot:scaffold9221_cov118-Isochrysis_galbana.AAC.4
MNVRDDGVWNGHGGRCATRTRSSAARPSPDMPGDATATAHWATAARDRPTNFSQCLPGGRQRRERNGSFLSGAAREREARRAQHRLIIPGYDGRRRLRPQTAPGAQPGRPTARPASRRRRRGTRDASTRRKEPS